MLNAKQFGEKIHKHRNTIYKWIKEGMPCIKTEKDYLIDYNEAVEWLKNRMIGK